MWLTNVFKKASAITDLERDLAFEERKVALAETESARLQVRLDLTEKALKSERAAKDKILLRYADQVSRQVKLPEHFVSDAAPKAEPPKPEPLSFEQEEKLRWLATEQRNFDIDTGADAPPLETYINALKNDEKKLAEALQL